MPRDSNGNYTPPAGPVVSGTTIESSWANDNTDDVATAMTNSLSRTGDGGMLAPMPFVDGTQSAPGMSWSQEPNTGFWRTGPLDMQVTVGGVPYMRWNGSATSVWDGAGWNELLIVGGDGTVPDGSVDGDRLSWDQTGGGNWTIVAASNVPTVVDQGSAPNTTLSWDNVSKRWIENLSVLFSPSAVVTANGFVGPLTGDVTGNLTGTASLATQADNATTADSATTAANATSADNATTADYATNAGTSDNSTQLGTIPAVLYPSTTSIGTAAAQPTNIQVMSGAEFGAITPDAQTLYFLV
jgi:hypothetical protein